MQIKESLNICQCVVVVAIVQIKESFKICQCVVVVAIVQIRVVEHLSVCCSSSNSANKSR